MFEGEETMRQVHLSKNTRMVLLESDLLANKIVLFSFLFPSFSFYLEPLSGT